MISFLKENKTLKIVSISVLTIIVLIILRSIVFHFAVNKAIKKLSSYNLETTIGNYELQGIKGALFENLCIKNINNDTVFYSDSIYLNLKFFRLFTGTVSLSEFSMRNTQLSLNSNLFSRFFANRKSTPTDSSTTDYAQRIERLLNAFFIYVPTTMHIDNFSASYMREKAWFSLHTPNFTIEKKTITGQVIAHDSVGESTCNFSGTFDPEGETASIILFGDSSKNVRIPYLPQRINTLVQFDSITLVFNRLPDENDAIKVAGIAQANNFIVQNKRISPLPVITKKGSINFTLLAGTNYIELDSASSFSVNNFSVNGYFRYEKNEHKHIRLKVPKQEFVASNIFESMPEGLFTSIRDMKVSGNLSYELDFSLDLNEPDSIKLASDMESKGFRINRYGLANLNMFNDTFTYYVYDEDRTLRTIAVNPASPKYTLLDNISPYLRYSVLTSEDGSFFYHRGFNEEALQLSISTNIKEKKFKRGGSTISMQLVKNLFLTRNKTISRKIEEIFIVWMIENMHLATKEKMYEVYLNIIEWGPGIYGIKEASQFYFEKKPSELSLNESIFLASIIPSPKHFKYSFEKDGQLKSMFSGYYSNLASIMLRREQISPSDTVNLKAEVNLSKAAKAQFMEPDTMKIDEPEDLRDLEIVGE